MFSRWAQLNLIFNHLAVNNHRPVYFPVVSDKPYWNRVLQQSVWWWCVWIQAATRLVCTCATLHLILQWQCGSLVQIGLNGCRRNYSLSFQLSLSYWGYFSQLHSRSNKLPWNTNTVPAQKQSIWLALDVNFLVLPQSAYWLHDLTKMKTLFYLRQMFSNPARPTDEAQPSTAWFSMNYRGQWIWIIQ